MPGRYRGKLSPFYFYVFAFVVLIFDQTTKVLVARYLPDTSVPVIRGVLHITYTKNPGGAFGILQSYAGLLTILTICGICLILIIVRHRPMHTPQAVSLALMLGGAAGNLIDRLIFDSVLDFIDFRIWPVFNLADVAITGGAILLICTLIFCPSCVDDVHQPPSRF